MIRFENTEVVGWKAAIRGMRNPLNSWDKSDTIFDAHSTTVPRIGLCNRFGTIIEITDEEIFDIPLIGSNDFSLMMKLRNAGTDHRKFMRMIIVYTDITAPLYWWKEYDTYRFGVDKNSCSTMHTIADKEFTMDDFSWENLSNFGGTGHEEGYLTEEDCFYSQGIMAKYILNALNGAREQFLLSKEKGASNMAKLAWWQMIQLLPSSYNQKRTVMMSYEALANMYHARKNHKLDCWRIFCNEWIPTLPYPELITGEMTDSQK